MDLVVDGLANGQTTNLNGVVNISGSNNGRLTTNISGDVLPPCKMPRAAPHIYSCFVVNHTDHPIKCDIQYNGHPEETQFDETVHVTSPAKDEKCFSRENFFNLIFQNHIIDELKL